MSRPQRSHAALLQTAVGQHRAGNLDAARKLYEQVLRAEPRHADALQMLGLVLIERGMPEKGFQLLRRAVAYAPGSPGALNNLAVELCRIERFDEAMGVFDKLLALDPTSADTHYNRARALQQLRRFGPARDGYCRVLELRPDHAGALTNLGVVAQELGDPDGALARFDAALAANPANPEALYNRGLTLHRLKRFAEAVDSYDQAIAIFPGHATAFYNRGLALHALGRPRDALASYDAALARKPDYAEAFNNRGTVLHALFRFGEAVDSFAAALALSPDYVDALFNLGNTLRAQKHPEAALQCYARVLEIEPTHAAACENRASCLLDLQRHAEAAEAFSALRDLDAGREDARGRMLHMRLLGCDWTEFQTVSDDVRDRIAAGIRADIPFTLLAHAPEAALQHACARAYVAEMHPPATPAPVFAARGEHLGEKIRLAYLSADFREHPVAFLMAGVFEQHDRARFEVIAMSFTPPGDGETGRRVAAAFDRFLDVSEKPDAEVAALMRDLGIDVAVDLMGHTADSRTGIFACRPAPVTVNYLGYPGTMGADYIDYIIADEFVVPPGSEHFYTERIARLPGGFQANDDRRRAGPTPSRAEAGLPATGFVFCCFNNTYKINPPTFAIWMRLLASVPDSVLWLVVDDPGARDRLRRAAAEHGIAPARLVFAARAPYPAHLARLCLADLFLDTFPFNAGATASDALWAGVPIVTRAGEAFSARMAGSLLRAVDLADLVTATPAEYEALARRLALDPVAHAGVKARLADRRATAGLFDTKTVCRELETAFTRMVRRQRAGLTPETFAVAPTDDAVGATATP